MYYLALVLGVLQLAGIARGQCEPYRFASYFSHQMVLQKDGARIWGYVDLPGMIVQLTVESDDGVDSFFYETTSYFGPERAAVWEATLDPMTPGGPYTISYRSSMCTGYLFDVYFGDVWMCSGQDNMEAPLSYIDGGDEELDDVENYPLIRTFHADWSYDEDPQYEPPSIHRNWAIASSENVANFSGLCWVYGRHLFDELQYPIGLIQSTHDGSIIESWSSPDANAGCYSDEIPEGTPPNGNSHLWNAQVHPYLRMSIYGYIFYQGESNSDRPDDYACSFPAMINDYRQKWFERTEGATNSTFPFGFVQLSPWDDFPDKDTGYPDLRWSQTIRQGDVPNDELVNVFMAVAVDLPDFDAPDGPGQPRHKRQISYRLSLGALSLAYDLVDPGRFQGPYPTSVNQVNSEILVEYDDGQSQLDHRATDGFEVCCSPDTGSLCNPIGNNTDPQQWTLASISAQGTSDVTLDVPCDGGQHVTGIRYVWRESPCPLEQCAVYSVENSLPAPPFIMEGYIEPSQ